MDQAERSSVESPEVAALRKKIRGETLSTEEQALLARATRKRSGPATPHAAIEAQLIERLRNGK